VHLIGFTIEINRIIFKAEGKSVCWAERSEALNEIHVLFILEGVKSLFIDIVWVKELQVLMALP